MREWMAPWSGLLVSYWSFIDGAFNYMYMGMRIALVATSLA